MAEERELQRLERKIDSLEERWREDKKKRTERINWWFGAVAWTFYVAAITAMVVLAATGQLHHH